MGRTLDLALGALNGVVGDYLHRTKNGLATSMAFVRNGAAVDVRTASTGVFGTEESPKKIAILVHGLMSTEDVFRMDDGETYGTLLRRDLGVEPLAVRYNSGRRISENGEDLDALLSDLVNEAKGKVMEILLLGHSMGGLVIRSATHAASERKSAWLGLVKRAFYVGSPHLGAPLERFGNVLTWTLQKVPHPITQLIADIVNLRSVGVKDLRYGNLRREDWEGVEADALLTNSRHPVPLLPEIRHHLVAGTLSNDLESRILFGDVLVPIRSAKGQAKSGDRAPPFPQGHVVLLAGMNHLRLAHDPVVYGHIRVWCEEPLS